MKAAISKVEITPQEACYLCGHAIRTQLSQGVLDPLYVTCLVLDNDGQKSVFLSFDLIMMDEELSAMVKQAVKSVVDCDSNHIIVSFIHTHAAPETSIVSVFNDPDKGVRPGYREYLVNCAKECVSSCHPLEEVKWYYASTQIEGYYSNRNSIEKPCDKSANMFKLVKEDDSVLAMMINMSCHPTVLGAQNYLISADLFGAIRTAMAKACDCEVFMMQGAAGDMGNRQYRQGNDENELIRMRDGIVPQLLKPLNWQRVQDDQLNIYETNYVMDYDIDLEILKERLELNQKQLANEKDATQIKLLSSGIKMLENVITQGEHVHLEFHGKIIQIGQCIMVCIPCELFNQLGMQIKQLSEEYHIIIWGYCDYIVGYLVEANEYGKSYESIATQIKKGESEKYVEYLKAEVIKRMNAS